MDNIHQLLKVIVGSRAHGLNDEKSDYDYRSVYIVPTTEILSIGYTYVGNNFIDGQKDNTAYEIGHFLHLALECNPTILEVFKAPDIQCSEFGAGLKKLFPYVWQPARAYLAFVGYGLDQRKKFLDKKDNRQDKYASAYIRTLLNLCELLETGDFNVRINDKNEKEELLKYKKGEYTSGLIINRAEELTNRAETLLKKSNNLQYNREFVNQYLLDLRKTFWNIKGGKYVSSN
jgi:hypothetical protein